MQRQSTLPHALATPHAASAAPPLRFCSLPADEKEVVADAVIIATGAVARRLPFKGSDEDSGFWNKGISACAVGASYLQLTCMCLMLRRNTGGSVGNKGIPLRLWMPPVPLAVDVALQVRQAHKLGAALLS